MKDSPDRASLPERVDVPAVPLTFSSSDFTLPPRERVAFYLAIALFVVISAVVTTIVVDGLIQSPRVPNIAGLKPEEQRLAIENFKLLNDVLWDRMSRTFDLIVSKALLPVFATIVGFLLGKRSR